MCPPLTFECIGSINFACCQTSRRTPKWEAKTRHRVSLVLVHVTTLEEYLKQQSVYQDSPKDDLSNSGLEIGLTPVRVPPWNTHTADAGYFMGVQNVRSDPSSRREESYRRWFSLQSDSRRTLIWRAPGTRYHQENTIERHRHGGAGWLVWGGIILGSRTDLHVQSVMMTGHIHRDVILEQHARLFRGAMCAEFLFMDDNARPHHANIVDECLQSEDITRMDWPAYSSDLNPIEHVWDMLGRRIVARQFPPACLPELRRALHHKWCNIPQDQIDNLMLSMPRRCKACIASSGRHTPY
ncbi:transposable element Tc3 transposase [Trichonephila clavipes]|nr:transposable element Tc3 transposase [Trichonephila clavipes]